MKRLFARAAALALLIEALVLWLLRVVGAHRFVSGSDFRAFYTGALMVLHGAGADLGELDAQLSWQQHVWPAVDAEHLNVWLNPPAIGLVLSPLALLSPEMAFVAWTLVLAALLAIMLAFLLDALPPAARTRASILAVTFPPITIALYQGQLSFVLAIAFLLAWRDLERRRDTRAGLWLALLLVKPQLAIVPALYLLRIKRFRPLVGLGVGALVGVALSLVVSGPAGLAAYANLLAQAGGPGVASSHRDAMQSFMGLVSFVMRSEDAPSVRIVWALGSVAAIAAMLARPARALELDHGWALVIVVAVFTSPHLHAHDLTLLLVAAVLAVRSGVQGARTLALTGYALVWLSRLGAEMLGVRGLPLVVFVELAAIVLLVRQRR